MDLDKYVALFDDGLVYHDLAHEVTLVSCEVDEVTRTFEFTISVADTADWSLRYRVLKVAQQFEDEHFATVRCLFRTAEELSAV